MIMRVLLSLLFIALLPAAGPAVAGLPVAVADDQPLPSLAQ